MVLQFSPTYFHWEFKPKTIHQNVCDIDKNITHVSHFRAGPLQDPDMLASSSWQTIHVSDVTVYFGPGIQPAFACVLTAIFNSLGESCMHYLNCNYLLIFYYLQITGIIKNKTEKSINIGL